jgi:hypothetical protein
VVFLHDFLTWHGAYSSGLIKMTPKIWLICILLFISDKNLGRSYPNYFSWSIFIPLVVRTIFRIFPPFWYVHGHSVCTCTRRLVVTMCCDMIWSGMFTWFLNLAQPVLKSFDWNETQNMINMYLNSHSR